MKGVSRIIPIRLMFRALAIEILGRLTACAAVGGPADERLVAGTGQCGSRCTFLDPLGVSELLLATEVGL